MSDYKQLKESTALSAGSSSFIESIYEDYLEDKNSVSQYWQDYFLKMGDENDKPRLAIQEKFGILAKLPKTALGGNSSNSKQSAVDALIAAYHDSGHRAADIDPLKYRDKSVVSDLELSYHGLSNSDLEDTFDVGVSKTKNQQMKLKDIISFLQDVYTGSIGIEVNHIHKVEEKRWIQDRLESLANKLKVSKDEQKEILHNLVRAEGLERYLHTRYVGQKRFSLEGGESLIPMLDGLIQQLGTNGTKEVVIGMAHRGRLNVLINILGKLPADLFDEFEGKTAVEETPGDVKYHLGFASDVETAGGNVHLALAFNPSHLEIVNPVIQGSVRARMERLKGVGSGSVMDVAHKVVPIQIHGDAAFANQGVIQETLQLSQVQGYRVGGTVHIIINNQVGFTTSNLLDARSSLYCSDPAKIIQAPVLHINGDDPEAVVAAAKIAADYVYKFGRDIVLDLVCYRRLGHNEADEPAITQPLMYQNIRSRKTTLELYAERLVAKSLVTNEDVNTIKNDYKTKLEAGVSVAKPVPAVEENPLAKLWDDFLVVDWEKPVDTTISKEKVEELSKKIFTPPEGFNLHRIVSKLYGARLQMGAGKANYDWGFAENLAYASLVDEGFAIRLSGEDCGRGTFAHRHAVIHDAKTGERYRPIGNLKKDQLSARVIDSTLSEEAVLGFEFGFSTAEPYSLTIWEAQFGDFANGAQVLFDQFITSGEAKWNRFSGLVVMLPHGYEGQGPEHSSGRLERMLQLCANNNIRVCVPTTPAQTFHMLRRQVKQTFRKPLIIMTPKSLLRHKLAVNSISDMTDKGFQVIIPEFDEIDNNSVDRIVFCSGKVYYDLLEERRNKKQGNVAIIRIEELYPFPKERFAEEVLKYPNAKEIVWTQEEHKNQGAWTYVFFKLTEHNPTNLPIKYIGRDESSSPAVGYASIHKKQQEKLINETLDV